MNGNPLVLDELRTAILLAEEAFPGISDSLVAHMVHRLQRYPRPDTPAQSLFLSSRVSTNPWFLFFFPQLLHNQDIVLLPVVMDSQPCSASSLSPTSNSSIQARRLKAKGGDFQYQLTTFGPTSGAGPV